MSIKEHSKDVICYSYGISHIVMLF